VVPDVPYSLVDRGHGVLDLGVFVVMRFPKDDWFVLPALETLYYVLGARLEQ